MSLNLQFPELSTKRLFLRQLSVKDAEILFKYWSDPEVTKYLNVITFKNLEQSMNMIRTLNNLYRMKEGIRWAIVIKKTDEVIGTCGYNSHIRKSSRGEIGYELGQEYWGNGYATEALKEIIRYGFKTMKLNRVEAFTVPEAYSSINLLKKLGFKKEGMLRDYGYWHNRYWDENIYSLLKRDWKKNK